jgi:hypothetical protein
MPSNRSILVELYENKLDPKVEYVLEKSKLVVKDKSVKKLDKQAKKVVTKDVVVEKTKTVVEASAEKPVEAVLQQEIKEPSKKELVEEKSVVELDSEIVPVAKKSVQKQDKKLTEKL